ncbi:MAG: DUF3854 domain-containing protein [Archaeoglobaceae archaeon]
MTVKPKYIEQTLEEFRNSGIPEFVTAHNLQFLDGELMHETLLGNVSSKSKYKKLDNLYSQVIKEGGWVVKNADYVKPFVPRNDYRRPRQVKYETPYGGTSTPLKPEGHPLSGLWTILKFFNTEEKVHYLLEEIEKLRAYFKQDNKNEDKEIIGYDPTIISEDYLRKKKRPLSEEYIQKLGREIEQTVPVLKEDIGEILKKSMYDGKIPIRSAWDWFEKRHQIPIYIVEGYKKALCLVSYGIPAIGVRGIYQWHPRNHKKAYQMIEDYSDGRYVIIGFDRDEEHSTYVKSLKEELKLSESLKECQGIVRHLHWSSEEGKGIDDLCVNLGVDVVLERSRWRERDEQQRHLNKVIARYGLEKYQRYTLLGISKELEKPFLSAADIETTQRDIITIDSAMGTGKTEMINELRKKLFPDLITIALSPTNATGIQTSRRWGIPHIHDFPKTPEGLEALTQAIQEHRGIVLCPNSLGYLANTLLNQKILLILDEANQVVRNIVDGKTMKNYWMNVIKIFAFLCIKAEKIILSESNILDRTIHFVRKVRELEEYKPTIYKDGFFLKLEKEKEPSTRVYYLKNYFKQENKKAYFYESRHNNFHSFILQFIKYTEKRKTLFLTTSKRACEFLEVVFKEEYPHKKIIRLDSDTVEEYGEFLENPNEWLKEERPDILICSPVIQSGVSIDYQYFQGVWAYFPCFDSDLHRQMLGRYRHPAPRFVFVPETILSQDVQFSIELSRNKKGIDRLKRIAEQIYGSKKNKLDTIHLKEINDLEKIPLVKIKGEKVDKVGTERINGILEELIIQFLIEQDTMSFNQNKIAKEWLKVILGDEGYDCKDMEYEIDEERENDIKERIEKAKEKILTDKANKMSGIEIAESENSINYAEKILNKVRCTELEKLKAIRIIGQNNFAGIHFNDPEACKILLKNNGDTEKSIRLLVDTLKEKNIEEKFLDEYKNIFKKAMISHHKFIPLDYLKVIVLKSLNIIDIILGGEYDRFHEIAKRFEGIMKNEDDRRLINYLFGLNLSARKTVISNLNRLIRRLGFKVTQISRKGERQQRSYQYQVSLSETEWLFFSAYAKKIGVPLQGGTRATSACLLNSKEISPPDLESVLLDRRDKIRRYKNIENEENGV